MAEHSAVNRRVVGSSPTSGASKINNLEQSRATAKTAKVPIVPIFVPTLFQNGSYIHSNRAQLAPSTPALNVN